MYIYLKYNCSCFIDILKSGPKLSGQSLPDPRLRIVYYSIQLYIVMVVKCLYTIVYNLFTVKPIQCTL